MILAVVVAWLVVAALVSEDIQRNFPDLGPSWVERALDRVVMPLIISFGGLLFVGAVAGILFLAIQGAGA